MKSGESDNEIADLARSFIRDSCKPVFLTGRAGTGKTSFLKTIGTFSAKNMVIVAPTGVAAINAGGTTIHSFFQIPFGPFVPSTQQHFQRGEPGDEHRLISQLKLSSERKEIMMALELLVIDEISMVRCDVLDAIDVILRNVRSQPRRAFGGVQVLYIGDLYQLPPVVKDEEWSLLQKVYQTPYFFSSLVCQADPPVYLELQKVYRQSDDVFIDLLNKVRNNTFDHKAYELLHKRMVIPGISTKEDEEVITLTTHNNKADEINKRALAILPGEIVTYRADIQGVFPDKSFPADEYLSLKPGAQVMFIKNDTEKIRRFFNGKIGKVVSMNDDKIAIECHEGSSRQTIELSREAWKNIRYSVDKKTSKVEEEELGSFTQFPLRLAWAITIHKSQGLTFGKAIIDAAAAFSPGQVYVALSRCTSLNGITLTSRIMNSSLHSDARIVSYVQSQSPITALSAELERSAIAYKETIIRSLFDYNKMFENIEALKTNARTTAEFSWIDSMILDVEVYTKYSLKFLHSLFPTEISDRFSDQQFAERLSKAGTWFLDELVSTKKKLISCPIISDNRDVSKQVENAVRLVFQDISQKMHFLLILKEGFNLENYRSAKLTYKEPPFTFQPYAGRQGFVPADVAHPVLYHQLREKREELANERSAPLYMICSTESIQLMANLLPRNAHHLQEIKGFGKKKVQQYGAYFIDLINQYCEAQEIDTPFMPATTGK